MDFPLLSIVLDVVMVGLLAGVILFGLKLNRQLAALRRSREELKGLLEEFGRSTDRAEAALDALKRGARENVHTVKTEVDKAEALKDDLAFLAKRGEEVADRLEAGISAGRRLGESGGVPGPLRADPAAAADGRADGGAESGGRTSGRATGAEAEEDGRARRGGSKSKSDLLKALQGMR